MAYFEERQTLQWEIWYARAYVKTREIYQITVMVNPIMEGNVCTIMILCVIRHKTYHYQLAVN